MTQAELNFNPPKLSPQCQKLYDRLKLGPIKNTQIRDELSLLEYRRRFKDLRDKYGIKTESKRLGHGVFEYSLKKIRPMKTPWIWRQNTLINTNNPDRRPILSGQQYGAENEAKSAGKGN